MSNRTVQLLGCMLEIPRSVHVHLVLSLGIRGVRLHSLYVLTACSSLFTFNEQHKHPRFIITKLHKLQAPAILTCIPTPCTSRRSVMRVANRKPALVDLSCVAATVLPSQSHKSCSKYTEQFQVARPLKGCHSSGELTASRCAWRQLRA